jgi:hypothetical protein
MLTPAPGQTLADAIGHAAYGMDPAEPIVFVRHIGQDDLFHRGPNPGGTLFVVPGIWQGMPPPLLAAMRARRACATTGRCSACGNALTLATGTLTHESDCPVADNNLKPPLRDWMRRVGSYARGRRIREFPGEGVQP